MAKQGYKENALEAVHRQIGKAAEKLSLSEEFIELQNKLKEMMLDAYNHTM
ncbi:hypothetical protein LRR81_15010 [Metabacillus sp. GX 13764]|uniref:hypothetical protein n=1 Tax=Metabacillus kandeliae TaxID=2900151 RepID=UPI001E48730C|nr:hypothetical protein [Metabacillus kandeliae]MCD7035554.1 hypothetical protein [Metabacillus kandeliae]